MPNVRKDMGKPLYKQLMTFDDFRSHDLILDEKELPGEDLGLNPDFSYGSIETRS